MMTAEQRKACGLYEDPMHFEEAEKAVAAFPIMDVDIKYFVDGESEIAVGDILTIKITLTNKKLADK